MRLASAARKNLDMRALTFAALAVALFLGIATSQANPIEEKKP
jgi:hypothetical protein